MQKSDEFIKATIALGHKIAQFNQPLGILVKYWHSIISCSAFNHSLIYFSAPTFQCRPTLTEPGRTVLVGGVSVTPAELLLHAESPFNPTTGRMGQ